METNIIGIKLENRKNTAVELQDILTKYGCSIRSRIGLHDNEAGEIDDQGIILLELTGDLSEQQNLENALKGLNGIQVKKMGFQ